MSIQDYENQGITVINDMNEIRKTRKGSIVFPNGWVASILYKSEWKNQNCEYSVAMCDYEGYFNWDKLNCFKNADKGSVKCNTEYEVCEVLEYIKNL